MAKKSEGWSEAETAMDKSKEDWSDTPRTKSPKDMAEEACEAAGQCSDLGNEGYEHSKSK